MAYPLTQTLDALWRQAPDHDHDGADCRALCEPLARGGLFADCLPREEGGLGWVTDIQGGRDLLRLLIGVGGADLAAGRLLEGHVNAVKLLFRYGEEAQRRSLATDIRAGAVCGVWNAEIAPGLRLDRDPRMNGAASLIGGKVFASGAGYVDRPLLTARTPSGDLLMLAPPRGVRPSAVDLSGWTVRGMRATATGSVNYTGVTITADDVIGGPGDYYRAPLFRAGAWRFLAVQTGAVLRLTSLFRAALKARGRSEDSHQRARLAAAAIAAETATLWVERAAHLAEAPETPPLAADAYVNMARLAVEQAALRVIGLAERGIGLEAFTRPHPVERVARDLSTYLRQPGPDAAMDSAASFLADEDGPPAWAGPGELAW